jgi:rhodanese-related sulfurtransferase
MMQRFSAQQLFEYLEHHQPQLVDVREPWEFNICHLQNSILLPMGQVPSHLEVFQQAQESVIICHHGIRSLRIAHFLAQQGIHNTINLEGGVEAWARYVDLDMPTY